MKEVNCRAKVGDYIKIVSERATCFKYKNGDSFRVLEVEPKSGDVRAEYDGEGNTGVEGYNYIYRDEYVVLVEEND